MRWALVVLLCGACHKSAPPLEWSDQPLKPIRDSAPGFSFELSIPDGLTKKTISADHLSWDTPNGADVAVDIESLPSALKTTSIEALAKSVCPTADAERPCVVRRKTTLPDGYAITGIQPDLINIAVFRVRGERTLVCRAFRNAGSGKTFLRPEAEVAWAEKICDSLTVQ